MTDKKPSIYLMSDEEFEEFKKQEEKDSLIDNLLNISSKENSSGRFSVRNMDKKETPEKKDRLNTSFNSNDLTEGNLSALSESIRSINQGEWENMLEAFNELSPIEDITEEERSRYRRRSDGDKFDEMFKKESSMLNDVLSDIQKRSKIVRDKIEFISGRTRDVKGITKNYVDLISASSTLDSTKLSVIKELVNIKKTKSDLRMKEAKLNPDDNANEQDRDTVADLFYKSIISGSAKDFARQSSSQYENMGMDVPETGFNITQRLPVDAYGNESNNYVDSTGYIANENRNVQICVYRYSDDTLEFIALDEDGVEVLGYELPDAELVHDLSIRPGAAYAYDKYGRKYKIIDADDVEETDNYADADDDDKYSFAAEAELEDDNDNDDETIYDDF